MPKQGPPEVPKKRSVETEKEQKWSKPLQELALELEEYVVPEEETGRMSWPRIENASSVTEEEFKRFQKHWYQKGVFVEATRREGNAIDLQVTNSDKPLDGISGVWFKAWTDRIVRFRNESTEGLKDRYGTQNEGFNRLVATGMHPGVWIGPDYEPRYFSEQARTLLIKNAKKIELLIRLCTEKGHHDKEAIVANAIPASLVFLNENLTQEHLDAIVEGITKAPAEIRENLMAYTLRAVTSGQEPEKITPELIIATFKKANAIIGPRMVEYRTDRFEESATLARYLGEFIQIAGKAYEPAYLDAFIKHADLVRKERYYFMENFGAAFFHPSHGTPPSVEEFTQCLDLTKELLDAYGDKDTAQEAIQSFLPHLVRKMTGEGTVLQKFQRVHAEVMRIAAAGNSGDLMTPLSVWSWTVKEDGNQGIEIEALGKVVDELLALEKLSVKNSNVLFNRVLPCLIRSTEDYFEPELLHQYQVTIEKISSESPQKLTRVLSMDEVDLGHVLSESAKAMSPDVFTEYVSLFAAYPKSVIEAAAMVYECADGDIDASIVDAALKIAVRIDAVAKTVKSRMPVEVIEDVTGHRGHGNDDKTAKEAIAMAEHYASFLENNIERIRELCPPSDKKWSVEWEKRLAFLKEYVLKHGGKLTWSMQSLAAAWKNGETEE